MQIEPVDAFFFSICFAICVTLLLALFFVKFGKDK